MFGEVILMLMPDVHGHNSISCTLGRGASRPSAGSLENVKDDDAGRKRPRETSELSLKTE